MSDFKLHHGSMDDVLKEYPDNYFTSIVSDPPYGIRMMGKVWDDFNIKKEGSRRDSYDVGEKRKASGRSTTGFGNSIEAGKYNLTLSANQQFQAWYTERCTHLLRVLRPGGYLVSFSSTRTHHRMISGIEDAGFEIRHTAGWLFASGFPKSKNNHELGIGSALKPAWEPICIARKPLEGTLEENFKKWGTGYLNIDACRIPGEEWRYGSQPDIRNAKYRPGENNEVYAKNVVGGQKGRWPADIMHDGSDEVLAMFPVNDIPSGKASGPTAGTLGTKGIYGSQVKHEDFDPEFYGDTGSAARFFYEAKCSREDRNEGCEKLPSKAMNWSSGDQNPGSFQSPNTDKSSPNHWPTVKPTNLMRYLIRLVNPNLKEAVILDPMMGSGSTLKAGIYEFVKEAVGIDQEEEALPIAEARCRYAMRNRGSMNIF